MMRMPVDGHAGTGVAPDADHRCGTGCLRRAHLENCPASVILAVDSGEVATGADVIATGQPVRTERGILVRDTQVRERSAVALAGAFPVTAAYVMMIGAPAPAVRSATMSAVLGSPFQCEVQGSLDAFIAGRHAVSARALGYAQGQRAPAMLYPTEETSASEERLDVCRPQDGGRHATVALRPVSLACLEDLVQRQPSPARTRDRGSFARTLLGS